MTEQELHTRVIALRKEVDALLGGALSMEPTIELCVFTGHLSAIGHVLQALEDAGAPVADPGEEMHSLSGKDT